MVKIFPYTPWSRPDGYVSLSLSRERERESEESFNLGHVDKGEALLTPRAQMCTSPHSWNDHINVCTGTLGLERSMAFATASASIDSASSLGPKKYLYWPLLTTEHTFVNPQFSSFRYTLRNENIPTRKIFNQRLYFGSMVLQRHLYCIDRTAHLFWHPAYTSIDFLMP